MGRKIGLRFKEHGTTTHAAFQYVDLNDRTIHTNTVEGAFSIFKRGMRGVYQHCGEHHLHRYLAEFEFRYNNRTANANTTTSSALRTLLLASLASDPPTQGLISTRRPLCQL